MNAFPFEWCTFVLSTSPDRELVNDFKKINLETFYMPLWSELEMEAVASLFSNPSQWRDRFTILGGIPRYVLEKTENDPTGLFEAACEKCGLIDCFKEIHLNSNISDKAVHSLVHMTSVSPFTKVSAAFASRAAFDIILRNKGTEAKEKMAYLLPLCDRNPLVAAICDYLN